MLDERMGEIRAIEGPLLDVCGAAKALEYHRTALSRRVSGRRKASLSWSRMRAAEERGRQRGLVNTYSVSVRAVAWRGHRG